MFAMSKLRLRQSVGIVASNETVEFFKANTRTSVTLKMKPDGVVDFLKNFDGKNSINEVCKLFPGTPESQIKNLAAFLQKEFVLIENDVDYPDDLMSRHYRLVNLLEDFFHRSGDVIYAIQKLTDSRVMIIGLGAVGSNLALFLARSGVKNFVLVDADVVDLSNIHRQAFVEADIGDMKTSALERQILAIAPDANVGKINKHLDADFFSLCEYKGKVDLLINCADEPSVDYTSLIVSDYAMRHNIPHIVGGGYNLHLTLVGQTIIPYKTACYKCFESKLNEINAVEFLGIKRLDREKRKLGSFTPLSGIAASLAALDAIKVLVGAHDFLQQSNKRIEFDSRKFTFNIIDVQKNPDCPWCRG